MLQPFEKYLNLHNNYTDRNNILDIVSALELNHILELKHTHTLPSFLNRREWKS